MYGRPFTLLVDNQPIVQIFSPLKSLLTLTTTKLHSNADALSHTGVSPTSLMLGRNIRSRLDILKPYTNITNDFNTDIEATRSFRGRISCRDYIHIDKWQFGRVIHKLGKLHYLVELDDKRIWKRHVNQIRSVSENTPVMRNFTNDTYLQPEFVQPKDDGTLFPTPVSKESNPLIRLPASATKVISNSPTPEKENLPVCKKTNNEFGNSPKPFSSNATLGVRRSKRTIKPPIQLNL